LEVLGDFCLKVAWIYSLDPLDFLLSMSTLKVRLDFTPLVSFAGDSFFF
jgi:hypothetical protein